ncbi:MAG: hypothetical protein ACRDJW_10030 [Thermomicrobiales bacterium]
MTTTANRRAIGPVGTLARVVVGLAAIALALVGGLQWWEASLGVVIIPLVVTFGQAWLVRQYPDALREVDYAGACATALIVAPFLIIPYTSDATWLWLGASMLLAAVRGYAGCEVLAISNWLLRRDDTVGCVLFTPIDQVETRWQRAEARDASRPGQRERDRDREEPFSRAMGANQDGG